MNLAQFNSATTGLPADFHVHIFLRGGTFVAGRYISTINLPGDNDLIKIRSSETLPPQWTFVAIEAIDAIEVFL